MNSLKLTEVYEEVRHGQLATDFVGSASEFRHKLGGAINSLTVLKNSPLEDKERIEIGRAHV